MKILFHENELNYRGTSIALYDYADFNEKYLGNESVIFYRKNEPTNHPAGIEKFVKRFETIAYTDFSEVEKYCLQKCNACRFQTLRTARRCLCLCFRMAFTRNDGRKITFCSAHGQFL